MLLIKHASRFSKAPHQKPQKMLIQFMIVYNFPEKNKQCKQEISKVQLQREKNVKWCSTSHFFVHLSKNCSIELKITIIMLITFKWEVKKICGKHWIWQKWYGTQEKKIQEREISVLFSTFFPLRRIEIEESESTSIHNVEWHECCVLFIGGS